MNIRPFIFLVMVCLLGTKAYAGEYQINCYFSGKKCASLISDLVSDRFTSKYPPSHWTIVVIGQFAPYSNGGGVGFAVAGVSPTPQNQDKNATAQVPRRRFISTTRILDHQLSPYEVNAKIESLVRDAVQDMIAECDLSPKCEIN